jgi:PAS domain S-box-containing protein
VEPGRAVVDAAIELTRSGEIVSATPLPPAWAGYGEVLAGRSVLGFVHPDDRERVHRELERVAQGLGHEPGLFRWRGSDGGWRWVAGRGFKLEAQPGDARLVALVCDIRSDPALNRPETEPGIEPLQRDNLRLLAGGVAHEFNNLLAISLGVAELTSEQLPVESPLRPHLADIVTASRRAAELARELLAAAGSVVPHTRMPVDLNAVLTSQAALLRTALPKSAQLELALCEESLWVEGDVTQLRHVVLNLLRSAGEAIGRAPGVVRVAASRIPSSSRESQEEQHGWAVIEVTDDGPGLDEELRRRIFEPRVSSEPAPHRIGLSVVSNVVEGHAGRIHVASAGARGTTVRVQIPLLAGHAIAGEHELSEELAGVTRSSGAVLLVDDDAAVRRVGAAMLRLAKFQVIEAADASTALALAEREADITCAVIDLLLRDRDGLELVSELQRRRAGIRIVICSGAVDRIPSDRPDLVVLEKPFRFAQLVEAVWRALGPRGS